MSDTLSPGVQTLPTDPAECEALSIHPEIPCATNNTSIKNTDALIFRALHEMQRLDSARVQAFGEQDLARINAYYDNILTTFSVLADNQTDSKCLIPYPLPDLLVTFTEVENAVINAGIRYLIMADYGLRVSESGRLNDRILPHDRDDFVLAIEKGRTVMAAFVQNDNPLESPHSTPSRGVVLPS